MSESLNKLAEEIKKTAKEKGQELTDEEALDGAERLTGLFELLWKFSIEDSKKKRRLKKEPNGFPIESNHSCNVCGRSIDETNGWYNWYGITCLLCKKAVDIGVIPAHVCTDRDSSYKMWRLKSDFGISHQTAKKQIREGTLKARIILDGQGRPYEYIFLRKENPHLIDPNRYNCIRKSYERNKSKRNERWAKEKTKEIREEFKEKNKKVKNRQNRHF